MSSVDVHCRNPFEIPELAAYILKRTAAVNVPSAHLATNKLFYAILLPHVYENLSLTTVQRWRAFLTGTPSSHLSLVRGLELDVCSEEIAFELVPRLCRRLALEMTAVDRARITSVAVRIEEETLAIDLLAGFVRLLCVLPGLTSLSLAGAGCSPWFVHTLMAMMARSSAALGHLVDVFLPLRTLCAIGPDRGPSVVGLGPSPPLPTIVRHLALPPSVVRLRLDVDGQTYFVDEPDGDNSAAPSATSADTLLVRWVEGLSLDGSLQSVTVEGGAATTQKKAAWQGTATLLKASGLSLRLE